VLARDATQIRARDVICAVGEPLAPVFCVDREQGAVCHRAEGCPTHWLWGCLGQAIYEVLDSVTLADLCERTRHSTSHIRAFRKQGTVTEIAGSEGSRERSLTDLEGLEKAYTFQQSVFDCITEPIMVIGTNYRVQSMNRAAREFSSEAVASAAPLLCYQVSHRRETPCNGVQHPCPLEQVRESGHPVMVIHKHHWANGEWRFVELIAAPLRQDGAFQGIVESARDITERVRAEEELRAVHALQRRLIDEERERIARELHDGLAQLLGYVNTKAMAVRLMLKSGETGAAEQHLLQLEEAARELFVDVREAIYDLRSTGRDSAGLAAALRDYVTQFRQLSGLPVELDLAPAVDDLALAPEAELQLLRIVQESLTNVRKHASAGKTWVDVRIDEDILELTVRDDGQVYTQGSRERRQQCSRIVQRGS
jgi:signal transduction histidine kinase